DTLAKGICSRETLKKYESGKCSPEKLRADALFQRLEKTVDPFYVKLDDAEYALARQRIKIQAELRRGKVAVAGDSILTYQRMRGTNDVLHRQFLYLVQAELRRRKKAPFLPQEEIITAGIEETFAGRKLSRNLLETRPFHLMELFLLQRYAVLLEEEGEIGEAVLWYEALLTRFTNEQRGMADRQKLYPPIAYRLAFWLAKKGDFDQAMPIIRKALKLLRYSKIQNVMYIRLRELELTVLEKLGDSPYEEERGYLKCLKKILREDGAYWCEDFFPTYLEPHLYSVNTMLKERRLAQGKTREEMAGTICDPRTIERQEKNCSRPQKRVWKALIHELGLSSLKYDRAIVTQEYKNIRKFELMIRAYDRGKIKESLLLYKNLNDTVDKGELTNRQFEKYWGAELRFRMGEISREERNQQLWEMLSWTLPLENKGKSFACHLTKYEQEALDSLAWDCGRQEIKELLPLLKKQFHRNVNVAEQSMDVGFYGKILYNIARGYLRTGDLRRAQKYITLAMEQRRFQDQGVSWDRLLFLRFQIEEQRLNLWEKKIPPESSEDEFRWAKCAWASAKENGDVSMCNFIVGYLKRHYRLEEIPWY
ncbi:MAG: hypothetical protein K2N63_09815, partial [Lachnospiraceae bacterium]|nr:hypothetical protein [Lachnospiraceae bacterium]